MLATTLAEARMQVEAATTKRVVGRSSCSPEVDCGFGCLDAPLLGAVLDYLTVEGILRTTSTARVFKCAVAHVSHFLTYESAGVIAHPRVWTDFAGAKRVVVRACDSPDAFEQLLKQLFGRSAESPTHLWKELHVGVPGDVFEEDEETEVDHPAAAVDDEDEDEDDGNGERRSAPSRRVHHPPAWRPAAVARLELVLYALRCGKLAAIEDLDIYSTDTLAWDEAPDDQILAPYEYATDGVKRVMTDILLALPPRVSLRSGLHWGALDLCKDVLDANPALDVDETTPYMDPVLVMWAHSLQFGSRPQHLNLLAQILARKPTVNVDGHGPLTRQTALCIAAYYLEVDCVDALLTRGADPNAGDQPPLLVCAGLHARDVLQRVYLGAAGPIFAGEDDYWARRRDARDDDARARDYDADINHNPKAYRRLYILKRLIDHGVDLAATYKGLSAMRVLLNDLKYFNKHRLDLLTQSPPPEDPFLKQLYHVILAELYKMADVLSDALLDHSTHHHATTPAPRPPGDGRRRPAQNRRALASSGSPRQ